VVSYGFGKGGSKLAPGHVLRIKHENCLLRKVFFGKNVE
jgi:hypothetical protein